MYLVKIHAIVLSEDKAQDKGKCIIVVNYYYYYYYFIFAIRLSYSCHILDGEANEDE